MTEQPSEARFREHDKRVLAGANERFANHVRDWMNESVPSKQVTEQPQPSEAQLRERAKWSVSSDASADAIQFGIEPSVVIAPQGDQYWQGQAAINPAQVAASDAPIEAGAGWTLKIRIPDDYRISSSEAPIEARVKALEGALAVLHDRIAAQENAWQRLLAVEVDVEKPAPEPVNPVEPKTPEAPIHAAIRASSEPKPMVGPMGNPVVK